MKIQNSINTTMLIFLKNKTKFCFIKNIYKLFSVLIILKYLIFLFFYLENINLLKLLKYTLKTTKQIKMFVNIFCNIRKKYNN